jgi:hypothetical protein
LIVTATPSVKTLLLLLALLLLLGSSSSSKVLTESVIHSGMMTVRNSESNVLWAGGNK